MMNYFIFIFQIPVGWYHVPEYWEMVWYPVELDVWAEEGGDDEVVDEECPGVR